MRRLTLKVGWSLIDVFLFGLIFWGCLAVAALMGDAIWQMP